MSETAQTLIESALRQIGALAAGETADADSLADGLEALRIMLRSWSADNLRIYYTEDEDVTLTGATSYTWGSGGTINTARPNEIRGAYTTDGVVEVITEAKYRELRAADGVGSVQFVYYQPKYPLGYLYPWPLDSSTLHINSIKDLTDPSTLATSVTFPTAYDEAIKYGLAVRLSCEYGREISPGIAVLATSALDRIERLNFVGKIPEISSPLAGFGVGFNIENG